MVQSHNAATRVTYHRYKYIPIPCASKVHAALIMSGGVGEGGGGRLIVGFHPIMDISPTASWIRWYMQVYACEVMLTCLVWVERSTPDNFLVPSHWFNSATGEQKGITQTIYTDSEPPSRLPNSLMPSAKVRSANLPVFMSLVWHGQWSNPGLPHLERTL